MRRIIFSIVCISLIFVSCAKKDDQDANNTQSPQTVSNGDVKPLQADINLRLYQAANDGDVNAVQAAISEGGDVNFMDGESPLMAATHYGHTDVVMLLLENGADVNAKTSNGLNAMYIALVAEHTEVIKLLLSAKVDINAGVPIEGKEHTPLAIAKMNGNTDIIELLEKAGAKE